MICHRRLRVHGCAFRIHADYAALGRIAAAASLGIDGRAGAAEVQRFVHAVIDSRDLPRWQRVVADSAERDIALAMAIALINENAARSDDPELSQWGWDFRAAIVEFRSGNTQAFTDLAGRYAAQVGVLL